MMFRSKVILGIVISVCVLGLLCLCVFISKKENKADSSSYYLVCKESNKEALTFIVNEKEKDITDVNSSVPNIKFWDENVIIFDLDDVWADSRGYKSSYTLNRISGEIRGYKSMYDFNKKTHILHDVRHTDAAMCEKTYKTKI